MIYKFRLVLRICTSWDQYNKTYIAYRAYENIVRMMSISFLTTFGLNEKGTHELRQDLNPSIENPSFQSFIPSLQIF